MPILPRRLRALQVALLAFLVFVLARLFELNTDSVLADLKLNRVVADAFKPAAAEIMAAWEAAVPVVRFLTGDFALGVVAGALIVGVGDLLWDAFRAAARRVGRRVLGGGRPTHVKTGREVAEPPRKRPGWWRPWGLFLFVYKEKAGVDARRLAQEMLEFLAYQTPENFLDNRIYMMPEKPENEIDQIIWEEGRIQLYRDDMFRFSFHTKFGARIMHTAKKLFYLNEINDNEKRHLRGPHYNPHAMRYSANILFEKGSGILRVLYQD